jgi:uncharacterized integral membrane protein
MTKFKAIWLLIFGAVLAVFVVQNWYYPNPPIHFLGFQFLPLPMPVILLIFFVLGFIAGWALNAFGFKGQKQEASSGSPPEK